MHFVDYVDLTHRPAETLGKIYEFLGTPSHTHNFEHVEQATIEDDFIYGFKNLHLIRSQVRPQGPQWPTVFDDAVFRTQIWKNIEAAAEFWKVYR